MTSRLPSNPQGGLHRTRTFIGGFAAHVRGVGLPVHQEAEMSIFPGRTVM
jgi:hypothetical protein